MGFLKHSQPQFQLCIRITYDPFENITATSEINRSGSSWMGPKNLFVFCFQISTDHSDAELGWQLLNYEEAWVWC